MVHIWVTNETLIGVKTVDDGVWRVDNFCSFIIK